MLQIENLRREFIESDQVSAADFDHILKAGGGSPDLQRVQRMLRRRSLGDPLEYVIGTLEFRGRQFFVDRRAYITDSELSHLVDLVVDHARRIGDREQRAPVIVEFGVGCGSLLISAKIDFPEGRFFGLDLDPDALQVARKNADFHQVDVHLFESDLFDGLPPEITPDLVFGDPPWGDQTTLYDDERPASHYDAMPTLSAYPSGGITGLHEAVLNDLRDRDWNCEVLLNLGILAEDHVARLRGLTEQSEVFGFDNTSVLCCSR